MFMHFFTQNPAMDVTQMFHVVSNRLMACVWARQTNRAIENGRATSRSTHVFLFFGSIPLNTFLAPLITQKKVECLCIFCVIWQVFLEPPFTCSIHFGSCKKTTSIPASLKKSFYVSDEAFIHTSFAFSCSDGRSMGKDDPSRDLGISMEFLGGGNSNIFGIFTPNLGEDEPNLTHMFKWVETTN